VRVACPDLLTAFAVKDSGYKWNDNLSAHITRAQRASRQSEDAEDSDARASEHCLTAASRSVLWFVSLLLRAVHARA
jgi:N-acetyl-anhydromuramyl-L-alanine amidase AmpD